jgi:hypothetical protein
MQAPDIKNTIDRAWGVVHSKHKKKEPSTAPPEASDPKSQERLQQIPIGQDMHRKRYWVVDGPCVFLATFSNKLFARICCYLHVLFFHFSVSFGRFQRILRSAFIIVRCMD